MVSELVDYKIKKQLADIDKLITELVIIRRYIYSAKLGLTYCREHVTRGFAAGNPSPQVRNEFDKNQEQLLLGLKQAEKRVKKELASASRELAFTCRHERAAR